MIPTTDTELNLLKPKIAVPALKDHLIPRDRLLDSVTEGVKGRITLICAPAGFGKTTLLAQWAHARVQHSAWVTLDRLDNDWLRFWRYIVHALASAVPDRAGRLLPLVHILPSASISTFLDALINELYSLPGPLSLILDNYQQIDEQRIHDSLSYFIDYLPPAMHIVISTRTELPFSTAKWMIREERHDIHALQLQFTQEETERFFLNMPRLNLSSPQIEQLALRTEGWVTGLQLISIALRSERDYDRFIAEFQGSHRSISDYLFHEVLSKLPDDVYRFVLATSVLDRMDLRICAAICPDLDNLTMLETVKQLNLFLVPLDDDNQWFRYYPLFARYLRELLQKTDPGQWLLSNKRASMENAKRGWMDEAIDHALAAEAYPLAELYLERHLPAVLQRGEVVTLLRWLESFPADFDLSLETLLLHSFVLMLTGQLQRSDTTLDTVEAGCLGLDDTARRRQLQSGILFVRSNIIVSTGAFDKWLSSKDSLLNDMLPANPIYYGFNYNITEPLVRRTSLGLKGQLSSDTEAVGKLFMGVLESHGWQHSLIHLYVKQSLAEGYYEWNKLDSSREAASFVEGAALTKATPGLIVPLRITQALLHATEGRPHVAHSIIEEAMEKSRSEFGTNWMHWMNLLRAFKARLYLREGQLAKARKELAPLELSIKDRPTFSREFQYVTFVRLLAKQRKEKEALRLLELLKPQCEREQLVSSLLEISNLQALLEYQRGHRSDALSHLHEALLIGEKNQYVRSFLDEGTPMAELLSLYAKQGPPQSEAGRGRSPVSAAYVAMLLSLFPNGERPAAQASSASDVSLSRSELNLLRLLRQGATNKQIAAELFLSEGTVKVYLSRLYEKLGVSSRTQALIAVQELLLQEDDEA
ncbi:LuxR C-terminal-related transcriptional regulator [Paenibacillus sp. 32352]|uniref:LuxR C-terminal-related transcriptional regulator n=1 Tax=Paenibacillus sp. 32352 TaxID=1969111 RepID=UPI0009ACE1FA|nr:LuxR C-terminal-related transcriptional regulator [Paenibacillus sp. 32352]